jgi:hypothetical protein
VLRPSYIPALLIVCVPATSLAQMPTAEQLSFFENKVRPILSARCYSCHSQSAKKLKGGLKLDGRGAILKGGDNGPALVPGKPAVSLLVKAIKYDGLEMPPSGKLPAEEIATLVKWVEMGAPWPEQSVKPAVSPDVGVLTPERLRHWAWQPLKVTEPPALTETDRKRDPIDRFVVAALSAKGMKPNPPADRRTLIRRAFLDLLGLPPAPEKVDAFVKDDSPDAYPKLIDELLASPHYGERWGRHWLDVARYSDGHGGFLDSAPLPLAWVYRDWVVKALNDDMPFDKFVKYQIAGDLMDAGWEAASATGFLAIGPTYRDDGGDPESIAKCKAETLDDRVDTVTRGFLGLTVSCARCHDHKFDPIPQADYYSIAGVFNNTNTVDRPSSSPDLVKRHQEHNKALDRANAALREATTAKDDGRRKELEAELTRLKANAPPSLSSFHGVADVGAADMNLAIRGDLRKPGPIVPRRFLFALAGPDRPTWTKGSGRLQLAEAIASSTNPLTARVIVNRVWQHHFGTALVGTPDNFGLLGERPSHPELLDWLAVRFMADGWSLKKLHRLIMLSDTYQMSSRFDAEKFRRDGDNRQLWRMSPRRLEVEAWRDSVLAVTGELDLTVGGRPVNDIQTSTRRTLYATISRNGDKLPSDEFLRLFDFPSARAVASKRSVTTVPQQSLFLLNSSFMVARGKAFAMRLTREARTADERIDRAYALLYGRQPTTEERRLAQTFLGAGDEAWPRYAQSLLSSFELFQVR